MTCSYTVQSDLREIIRHPLDDPAGKPLPGLADELITTLQRNDRIGHASVGWIRASPVNPIPFAEHAADAADRLRGVLSTWVRDLWETHGYDVLDCEDTLQGMAAWLLRHRGWMSLHPAAGELYLEITDAIAGARRVIDRAPSRQYSGICGAEVEGGWCAQPLYSAPEHAWVRCRTCGSQWVVVERRQWLLDQAVYEPLTATVLAGLLTYAGIRISAAAIRGMAFRGVIQAVDRDSRQRPRYRIADVREVLTQNAVAT